MIYDDLHRTAARVIDLATGKVIPFVWRCDPDEGWYTQFVADAAGRVAFGREGPLSRTVKARILVEMPAAAP